MNLVCIVSGFEKYSDKYDQADPDHLIGWLREHPEACQDIDVICSHQVAGKVFKAPYTEPSALPWEIKVVRGPDGICYLSEK